MVSPKYQEEKEEGVGEEKKILFLSSILEEDQL
jgi:hypothetical protein